MNEIAKKTVNSLTNQRKRLDIIKKGIEHLPKSRGTALAFTALERGRMWIGEICRELGELYPYEKTKTATTAEGIQPAVDVSDAPVQVYENEIVGLNAFREELETECDTFLTIAFARGDLVTFAGVGTPAFKVSVALREAYKGLKEARMWLGIRLGEIREDAAIIAQEKELSEVGEHKTLVHSENENVFDPSKADANSELPYDRLLMKDEEGNDVVKEIVAQEGNDLTLKDAVEAHPIQRETIEINGEPPIIRDKDGNIVTEGDLQKDDVIVPVGGLSDVPDAQPENTTPDPA